MDAYWRGFHKCESKYGEDIVMIDSDCKNDSQSHCEYLFERELHVSIMVCQC